MPLKKKIIQFENLKIFKFLKFTNKAYEQNECFCEKTQEAYIEEASCAPFRIWAPRAAVAYKERQFRANVLATIQQRDS